MSEKDEAVRRVVDAMNRADFDAMAESVTDDFELDFSNSRSPLSDIYRGQDGVREFMASFFEPWASLEFDLEEIIELSDDRMLTTTQLRMRGHGSGVEVGAKGATLWTIRDGKVAAAKLYQSKDEALEAAGPAG